MDIFSLLPLLKGWTYEYRPIETKTINKGDTIPVDNFSGEGWLLSIVTYAADNYVQPKLYIDDIPMPSDTILAMYNNGETTETPHRGWLTKYDAGSTTYRHQYIGKIPRPFKKQVKLDCSLTSAGGTTANVTCEILYIKIIDRKAFNKSLRAVLSHD